MKEKNWWTLKECIIEQVIRIHQDDILNSEKGSTKALSILVLVSLALALTIGFGVYFSDDSPQGNGSSETDYVLENYMKRITEIRGLNFNENVPMGTMTKEKLRDYMEEELENNYPKGLENSERTMRAFGLMPKGVDLENSLIKLQTQGAAGFYDPEVDKFYVIGEKSILDTQGAGSIIIHELTHALQDQHFDLESLPSKKTNDDDFSMAVNGLIEGDATNVMVEYAIEKYGVGEKEYIDTFITQMRKSFESYHEEENIPLILAKSWAFQYIEGFSFVREISDGNWQNVNESFEKLPLSTEQILHPQKYLGSEDLPMDLVLPSLDRFLGDEWRRLDNSNVGEYQIGVLFEKFFPSSESESSNLKARNGWDGDSYYTYYNREDEELALVWLTTWDTEKDAEEFEERYTKLLTKKYNSANPVDEGEVFLERKGKDVLIIEGVSKSIQKEISSEVWKNFEKKEMSR